MAGASSSMAASILKMRSAASAYEENIYGMENLISLASTGDGRRSWRLAHGCGSNLLAAKKDGRAAGGGGGSQYAQRHRSNHEGEKSSAAIVRKTPRSIWITLTVITPLLWRA